MKQYRRQRLTNKGRNTSSENTDDAVNATPVTIHQSPDNHSSFEQSAISK